MPRLVISAKSEHWSILWTLRQWTKYTFYNNKNSPKLHVCIIVDTTGMSTVVVARQLATQSYCNSM